MFLELPFSFVDMDALIILGYLSAVLIGAIIGLLGGGGAILAVPVFVYLMGIDTIHATAYSLFLVGLTSGIAAINYYRQGLVDFKAVVPFVIPSVIFLYATRRFLLPIIPDPLFHIEEWSVSRKGFMMIFFAILMLVAGVSMILRMRKPEKEVVGISKTVLPWMISIWGTIVGLLAGIVGAGGGFMIIPVMILFLKIPVKTAVGTSLVIICIQSLTGFAGDLGTDIQIDWHFLLLYTATAVVGMVIGSFLSKLTAPDKIRKIFAWFILCMGCAIILIELL
ncbi:MAG: sulfite exporter TauE/SafE family protein [Flavobacteriales bacterium]|nr:sulfite exporter TauE/SafE family protein [Flavobacteriales bacterium]